MFYALAPPIRREILRIIASRGKIPAADIIKQCSVSGAAISQHLKVLREANLVKVEKKAQQRIYQINVDGLLEINTWTLQLTNLWNERFEKLDNLLEIEKKRQRKNKGKD